MCNWFAATDSVTISGTTPAGTSYSGQLAITTDGQAFRLEWSFPGHTPAHYDGVGFFLGDAFYASRSPARSDPDPDAFAGIVRYDTSRLGDLPARWYHPSLNGNVCNGRSTDGPPESLSGIYTADYSSADGHEFLTLLKTISPDGVGYRLSWTTAGHEDFSGVGAAAPAELYAAWSNPPRAEIQVMRFAPLDDNTGLHAQWLDALDMSAIGTETIPRPS